MDNRELGAFVDFAKALPHTCPEDLCALCGIVGDIMRKHGYTNEDIYKVLSIDNNIDEGNEFKDKVLFYGHLMYEPSKTK